VSWLKKGVEDWNEAFAAAGFKNAIIGKEAPTAAQDPKWSPEDVRYSVIRWLPSTTQNASGPRTSATPARARYSTLTSSSITTS
jgi:hypothetical protein